MKLPAWIILPLLGTALLRAQDDLPRHAPGDSLGFEPKLMLDGPHAALAAPSPTASPEDRVAQLEAALLLAQNRVADSEQLFKEGILAKVEVEGRVLRVVQIREELAAARLIVAAARVDAVKKSFAARQASQADLAAANAALGTARETAAATSAEWDQAQIDAAALDLKRKRKLYAEGVGSMHEVQVAEDRLVLLSGTASR